MSHLHFQPTGGAAGDMILASLISAGAPLEEVSSLLQGLGVPFELSSERADVSGLRALHVRVTHPREHSHRTLEDVVGLISNSSLPRRVVERSLAAFRRLAEAEGAVHGVPPEEVTFHEVGAVDSIVDTVGSCVALELLGVESVSCGPLPLGHGTVSAAHGPLPVPAPATLEILKGSRVYWTEEPRETTTPTGAALMQSLTSGEFTESPPPMTLRSIGYGAGTAILSHAPNLLRAAVGELEGPSGSLEILEANVDDVPGELLGSAVDRLLEAGAPDAWLEPIVMKRGRGAYKLCALAESGDRERLISLMMRETGTLGVRHRRVGRSVASRRVVTVELPYGECRVKVGELDGEVFSVAPEYADAERLSRESRVPLPRLYEDARAAFRAAE
ncbi:nickel pincer cofactor biosynthesis protein LarC [Rubrobacter aplysinae]|uniref:nickel pincer cofactor biosynthesis protein LarC n=1 Tax=Rubrobacter aplysinae TaxID=909625 RepID=UPI00064C2CF1|nr:nickel pincer cofactor biosynthesis protein LarC [Rubrobacter aplysinae]